MKMQNIFILYAMALFGLGRGLCSEWRRGDCKSVGAPAFVLSELRNRKAKPLITALFSATAPARPAYCLFVVHRDSRQGPPAMHNESMTPLRSRDGPGSLEVSLPNYMGVCRTRADGHATAQPYAKRFARRYQRATMVLGIYSGLPEVRTQNHVRRWQPASIQPKIAHNCHPIRGL